MSSVLILAMLASVSVSGSAASCRVTAEAVAEGAIVDEANTAPAVCPEAKIEPKLRFDPLAGVARSAVALEEGEPLGRVFLPSRPAIIVGDRIVVAARLGKVAVSREVTALQSARPGQRFFARGDDGSIFAAPPLATGEGP